jgi:hypothetical protein
VCIEAPCCKLRLESPANVTRTFDLRRAQNLMSQARVDPDHAERALGHTIGGVRGVYDRHAYRRIEKKSERRSRRWRIDHILKTVRW